MQHANREIIYNEDEDLNEFDENLMEGEEQPDGKKLDKQEQLRLKEIQAKQSVGEGISLTHGEIKKHETIDWNHNSKLNSVTKACLNAVESTYLFDEYLNERALKDPKFVDIRHENNYLNSQN